MVLEKKEMGGKEPCFTSPDRDTRRLWYRKGRASELELGGWGQDPPGN